MKTNYPVYWASTAVIAFCMLSGGIVDVMHVHSAVVGMVLLGYAPFFMTILGTWKILGTIAILIPRFPLLKEWAYAGMFFDLTGASASYLLTNGSLVHAVVPLILAAILLASWATRPASRKLNFSS